MLTSFGAEDDRHGRVDARQVSAAGAWEWRDHCGVAAIAAAEWISCVRARSAPVRPSYAGFYEAQFSPSSEPATCAALLAFSKLTFRRGVDDRRAGGCLFLAGLNVKVSRWIKIGLDVLKKLAGEWNDETDRSTVTEALVSGASDKSQIGIIKIDDSANHQELKRYDSSTTAEGVAGGDGRSVGLESRISVEQERERRRKIVRQFFNDFWRSTDDKPVTFVERLNRAEAYINDRLAASGEAWQLDPTTRNQLGLPPPRRRAPP